MPSSPLCEEMDCVRRVFAKGLCSMHYRRKSRGTDPNMIGGVRACSACGALRPMAPRARYCSDECRREADATRRRKPRRIIACATCGVEFEAARSDARYCSKRCLGHGVRDTKAKTCSADGCELPVRARGLCAKHWRRWARSEGIEKPPEWTPERRSRWKAREAAKRMRGGAVEPVDASAIFQRDGWICQICQERVDPDLPYPDPMSKSLDHVMPLSRGGSHTPANVQLAHLFCNLSKGACVPA